MVRLCEKWPVDRQLQDGVIFLAFLQSNHQRMIKLFSVHLFHVKVKMSATAEFCSLVVIYVVVIFMQIFLL